MEIIQLEKHSYSEWVVRNALYWLTAISSWQLESNENHWLIKLEAPEVGVAQELDRLLNDYTLRERIMVKTDGIRDEIAVSVLKGIQTRLAE